MRILHKQLRDGRIRVRAESLDDLWELSHVIAAGDAVRARTERKVAVGADRARQERKSMTLTVQVTDAALEHDVLRIRGTITEGPEDLVSFGDHHSLSVTPGVEVDIVKQWDALSLQRIEEAARAKPLNTLVVTFDRESAHLAELTRRGYEVVQTLTGDVTKKGPGGGSEDFWRTIADAVASLDARKQYATIVAASPAFWTEYLVRALPPDVAKKTVTASCSAVGEAALAEVVKRPELTRVLEADRVSQEEMVVAHVLEAIATDKACYGRAECAEKAALGQVKLLVVTATLVGQAREEGWYAELDAILEQARATKADVHLIEHATQQLDALGGIAGVLRW